MNMTEGEYYVADHFTPLSDMAHKGAAFAWIERGA